MVSFSGDGCLEEFLIISGLIGVQVIYSFYVVFLNQILSLGFNALFLVVFGNLITAFFLLPFAAALEKKKWPKSFNPALLVQFVLIALGGVTTFQTFMFLGIKNTSPAIASAMPNLAPGFIFIIAACLRFEKVDMNCKYSRAKIFGTLVCLLGAIAMSFLQSPTVSPTLTSHETMALSKPVGSIISKEWIVGCMYLLAAVIIISCTTVLQAATMRDFPAPISLCVITSILGSVLTALLQLITEGKLDVGSPDINLTSTVGVVLAGATVSCVCVTFQTWCINKKGPVLVSMFSPIQTVCSAVLSAIVLGKFMGLVSLTGMFLMFAGLHIVLWAKKKETCNMIDVEEHTKTIEDIERPLLS